MGSPAMCLGTLLSILVLIGSTPLFAQIRPGLAHRIDAAAMHPEPALPPGPVTHDPDADGALIGAAVGTAAVSAIIYGSCQGGGECGAGALLFGTLIGGLGGLVMGGLIDAADPMTSPQERHAAEAPPDSTRLRGREPVSRRNDAIGAVIGAVGADLLAAGVCSAASDTDGCPIFHPVYLPFIAIGALVGAGIGSAFGDSADESRE